MRFKGAVRVSGGRISQPRVDPVTPALPTSRVDQRVRRREASAHILLDVRPEVLLHGADSAGRDFRERGDAGRCRWVQKKGDLYVEQ